MAIRVLQNRDMKFRGCFTFEGKTVVVFNDPDLVVNDEYDDAVKRALIRAWEDDDFFVCQLYNAEGEVLDSVSSMASYGGPKEAAEVAVRDYFS